jgi:hypothetical protein
MSEEQDTEKSEKYAEMQESLTELKEDVDNIQQTFKTDKGNFTNVLKYYLSKYATYLVLIGLGGTGALVFFDVTPVIPESVIILVIGIITGGLLFWMPANWLVNKFVKDERVPIVEDDPTDMHDFGLLWIPREKVKDVKVSGEMQDLQTKKGRGYEVNNIGTIKGENGKTEIVAEGNWLGESSALKIKRRENEIESMREDMAPLVEKALAYEKKWPHIGHKITRSVMNDFTREFEDVTMPGNTSVYQEVENVMQEAEPSENQESEQMQEMLEQIAGNMENGES